MRTFTAWVLSLGVAAAGAAAAQPVVPPPVFTGLSCSGAGGPQPPGTDTGCAVTTPGGVDLSAVVVDPVQAGPDSWRPPIAGSAWVTPLSAGLGGQAIDAAPGTYRFSVPGVLDFVADPQDPNRTDPAAGLSILWFVDNTVSRIELLTTFGTGALADIQSPGSQTTAGRGSITLADIFDPLGATTALGVTLLVDVDNARGVAFNPVGLDLVASVVRVAQSVSTPGSLALVGLGFIGIGLAARAHDRRQGASS